MPYLGDVDQVDEVLDSDLVIIARGRQIRRAPPGTALPSFQTLEDFAQAILDAMNAES
jgi:hypothetical protein